MATPTTKGRLPQKPAPKTAPKVPIPGVQTKPKKKKAPAPKPADAPEWNKLELTHLFTLVGLPIRATMHPSTNAPNTIRIQIGGPGLRLYAVTDSLVLENFVQLTLVCRE